MKTRNERAIKFRAWDFENKKMIYPDALATRPKTMTWDGHIYRDGNPQPYYLMQYTGFKDRNGKEIYEGDKIRITDTVFLKGGEIRFINTSWCVFVKDTPNYYFDFKDYTKKAVITGHIFLDKKGK